MPHHGGLRVPGYVEFGSGEGLGADLVAEDRIAEERGGGAELGELDWGELAEVTVGAFAIGVSGVSGGGGGNDLHERIPEGFPLEQTFANSGFAGNLDRLAAAAQGGARAMDGGEGARGVGIGEGGEELAQVVQRGVPPGPAEARSAAHQAAAEEELAEARLDRKSTR